MSPIYVPGKVILQSQASNDPLLDLNTQPSLDLQFATSKTLNDRVSGLPLVDFQRNAGGSNSPGTYVGSDGLIKTSPVNLFAYSEEFDQWQKFAGITVTANSIADPSGNLTADTIVSTAANEYIYRSSVGTAGVEHTFSVWLKADTARNVGYIFYDNVAGVQSGTFAVSTDWQRFEVSKTFGAGAVDRRVGLAWSTPTTFYAWGAQLEKGSTASPYIKTTNLPSAAPRFDHDPTTGESLGLLIEESRENLETYSEVFTDSSWIKTDSSVLPNNILSPDGLLNGTKVVENTVNGAHGVYKNYSATLTSGATYTHSVFAKAAERTTLQLSSNQGLDYANFNLSTGAITYATSGSNASIVALSNGWYRCSASFTPSNVALVRPFVLVYDTDNPSRASTYTGDGTSGVYIWGAQLEAGDFPTSYIPTSGSTVPRAADVASITGSNFSRWYNQGEGTISFRVKSPTNPVQYPVVIDDSTNNNRHLFAISNSYQYQIRVSGSTEAQMDAGSVLSPFNSIAGGYKTNNTAVALNGSVNVDNIASIPTCNRLSIYRYSGVTFNGHISRLTYYPYRLPDATLQEITS